MKRRPATPGFQGALVDIDGTLLDGDEAIPGAARAITSLRRLGIPFRLSTNTTRRPRRIIAEVLRKAGIEVAAEEVVAPSSLARRAILASGDPRAMLLVPETSKEDFQGVREDGDAPAFVVVGDLGNAFSFERLNEAFLRLRNGSRLIALQKNPYWNAGSRGLLMDAGAFVAALEYASGVAARVVGKPSQDFYRLALEELGVPAAEVVSVGDSLVNDAEGAARAGCRTVLVRTGVFDPKELEASPYRPDAVLDSIAGLFP